MIRRGNLSEVEDWIKAGKPPRAKPSHNSKITRSMLEFGTEVGFYSLIELLLKYVKWTKDELGDAIHQVARDGREDLISLLLENDAPWECAEADEIIATMNEELIRRFLALGMCFDTDDAFFTALDCKRARPLLRIYKVFRPEHPELDDQIAKSLVSSIKEKRVWWSIMLMWAGADPNRPVPYELSGPVDDDSYTTTALEEAYQHCDIEFLEQLKIESKAVDLAKLLDRVSYKRKPELIARIVKKMKLDELNSSESNSCEALEYLVGSEHYDYQSWMSSEEQEQRDQVESISLLLNAGARWNPYIRSQSAPNSRVEAVEYHISCKIQLFVREVFIEDKS